MRLHPLFELRVRDHFHPPGKPVRQRMTLPFRNIPATGTKSRCLHHIPDLPAHCKTLGTTKDALYTKYSVDPTTTHAVALTPLLHLHSNPALLPEVVGKLTAHSGDASYVFSCTFFFPTSA